MADTSIKFSSVETAVNELTTGRNNMESTLDEFANIIRTLIANGDLVGTAADTFEQSFEDLKKNKFESYITLVQEFADVISKAGQATQATAQGLEADASQTLYH